MQRFFFHLHEPNSVSVDDAGIFLPDRDAAEAKAITAAREVMCKDVRRGRLCLDCHVEVTDAEGDPVFDLPYRDAIEISGL